VYQKSSTSDYLNNGDAEERASEADSGRRDGHDRGAEEEADGHGDGRDRVSAGDYLRLHGHEESWKEKNCCRDSPGMC
jgi:hypothetical protein